MNGKPRLFMVILGATPKGRLTEQHDVFFGIATSLAELVPQMIAFWPEADGKIHIDSWREVTAVDGYRVEVVPKHQKSNSKQLFFLNLGGYKPGDLEEYHYKILAVDDDMAGAIRQSKASAFYKHFGFRGAESHIDDKYGVDVDDRHNVSDILAGVFRQQYALQVTECENLDEDQLHIGYLKISKLII